MNDPFDDVLVSLVQRRLAQNVDGPVGFIRGYVLLTHHTSPDGGGFVIATTMDDQSPVETMGIVEAFRTGLALGVMTDSMKGGDADASGEGDYEG